MCVYKVKLRLAGRMTQLPDSQKIFGALMHRYAKVDEQKVTEFTKQIREGMTQCNISNLMPSDYLPVPRAYLNDALSQINAEDKKSIYKEIKKRQFVRKCDLNKILNSPEHANQWYPYVVLDESQDIHASIESLRLDVPGLNPNVYSVPNVTAVKVEQTEIGEKRASIHEFEFYLAIKDETVRTDLTKLLKQMQDEQEPMILGPRASQGLNLYYVIGYEEEKEKEYGNYYLNLGMMLPKQIDFTASSTALEYFTSERKPYHLNNYNKATKDKRYSISFIKAGSIVGVDGDKAYASKSIQSPFDEKAIVFGNSFLFPIPLEDGGLDK